MKNESEIEEKTRIIKNYKQRIDYLENLAVSMGCHLFDCDTYAKLIDEEKTHKNKCIEVYL